jgi:hypothetical protein
MVDDLSIEIAYLMLLESANHRSRAQPLRFYVVEDLDIS